ncbi:hypothetical protein GWO43_12335 [candidate division KSB1 bacterium]|nr:hypothetical protein [candidate division KSB1 bacterium]NIR71039.1 hypothetical protein [candidate division KSB1 bacterium]NIS24746.1 hypothetical protein [candidate division KSB1 bacterium]NIT71650.1 hypothetical protein [candidate division KSB1 bacterium]NIU25357.1 hypothetical protein [candidate division KSB1 bacterium]
MIEEICPTEPQCPDQQKIHDSPAPEPDDNFWLEQGKKMMEESLSVVRKAAKAIMTGLGLLKAFYLGLPGFANFIPKQPCRWQKELFVVPLLLWLVSLYSALSVVITEPLRVNLRSPDNIATNPGRCSCTNSAI